MTLSRTVNINHLGNASIDPNYDDIIRTIRTYLQ
jgi:hypothetical protein